MGSAFTFGDGLQKRESSDVRYPEVGISDLVTRTGEREISAVLGRLPDNPGEWAYMIMMINNPDVTTRTKKNVLLIELYRTQSSNLINLLNHIMLR